MKKSARDTPAASFDVVVDSEAAVIDRAAVALEQAPDRVQLDTDRDADGAEARALETPVITTRRRARRAQEVHASGSA